MRVTATGRWLCQPAAFATGVTVAPVVGLVVLTSVRKTPDITVLLPLVLRTWIVTGSSTVQPTHCPSTKFVTATAGPNGVPSRLTSWTVCSRGLAS